MLANITFEDENKIIRISDLTLKVIEKGLYKWIAEWLWKWCLWFESNLNMILKWLWM